MTVAVTPGGDLRSLQCALPSPDVEVRKPQRSKVYEHQSSHVPCCSRRRRFQTRFHAETRFSKAAVTFAISITVFCSHSAGTTLPHLDVATVKASTHLRSRSVDAVRIASPETHKGPVTGLKPPSEVELQLRLPTKETLRTDELFWSRGVHAKSDPRGSGPRVGMERLARNSEEFHHPPFKASEPNQDRSRAALLKLNREVSPTRSSSRSGVRESEAAVLESVATETPLDIDCGWCRIPHPLKVHRGGEDVHLISRAGGNTLMAVFDGVGGWAELGVDPAEYARQLSALLEAEFVRHYQDIPREASPLLTFLSSAFRRLECTGLAGSCTVCAALLTQEGALHVLNVGDSGLHVVRDGASAFATPEQQHYFNCPFQLGKGSDDSPADADYYVLDDLAEDDFVVLATDGMWDNLFEGDFLSQLDHSRTCEHIARSLSEMANRNGQDPTYGSPFAINARRHGMQYCGGKLDDVTVVVSRVVRSCEPADGSEASAMYDSGDDA